MPDSVGGALSILFEYYWCGGILCDRLEPKVSHGLIVLLKFNREIFIAVEFLCTVPAVG